MTGIVSHTYNIPSFNFKLKALPHNIQGGNISYHEFWNYKNKNRKGDTPNLRNLPKITQLVISRSEIWTSAIWLQMRTCVLDRQLILRGVEGGEKKEASGAEPSLSGSFFLPSGQVSCSPLLGRKKSWGGGEGGKRCYSNTHPPIWKHQPQFWDSPPDGKHLLWQETGTCVCSHACWEARFGFVDSPWKTECIPFLASLFNHAWSYQIYLILKTQKAFGTQVNILCMA